MTNLAPLAISVQQARSTYAYGQLGAMPVSTTAAMLLRVGLPAAVSEDAVVSSATLYVTQTGNVSGSVTVNLRKTVAGFNVLRTSWSTQPAMAGATVGVTKASPTSGTVWAFDVTSDVQGYASGALANLGWALRASTSGGVRMRGSKAAMGQPVLVVEYVEPGDPPEDLNPNGSAVSLAKPVLGFLVAPDTSAVLVQVATDTVTVDFDSGEIVTDVGQVDLATTAFGGLVSGAAAKLWRARSRGATGLTGWSAWASMWRVDKPTVAITSPGASSDDTTPPIIWSVSGGTQESWRVIIRDGSAAGPVLADSGRVASSATTWTPPEEINVVEGATVHLEVRVWDDVDRVVTPGDPDYASAPSTFTLSTSAGVTPPVTATATNDGFSPAVVVTATAVSAPDGWVVTRDGRRVFTDKDLPTSSFSWTDWDAVPNVEHTYRVARIVGDEVSAGGPTPTVTPRPQGMWLVDPTVPDAAVLWGVDEGTWSAAELAVIHQPLAGMPVRRVAYRPPMSGSMSGQLVDVGATSHDESRDFLYDVKSSEADRVLRLVVGDRSIPVNVGDITVRPVPNTGDTTVSMASFTWWQVARVPWTT